MRSPKRYDWEPDRSRTRLILRGAEFAGAALVEVNDEDIE